MNVEASVSAVMAEGPMGAAVGASVDGQRWIAVDGRRDIAGAAVTVNTQFDLASVSKVAATTAAVHRLARLGALHFDDPVTRFLPSAPSPEATVRDLLTHRAGLWEWQPLYFTDDPLHAIDTLPLRYPPNSARHYSDLGFMLLGRIISAVTGATLERAVRELVLDPAGLTETGYGPVHGDTASSALGDTAELQMVKTGSPYPVLFDVPPDFAWRESEIKGSANDGNCFRAFRGVAGHAGLFSTVGDLLTLGESLALDDLLWGADVSAEMFSDGPDHGQALGWRSMTVTVAGRVRRMVWHPGFTGCAFGFVPGEDITVVLMTNRLFGPTTPAVPALWASALAPLAENS